MSEKESPEGAAHATLDREESPGNVAGQTPADDAEALIALSQWPELSACFEVLGDPGAAVLAMQLDLKAAAVLPGASQRGDGAVDAAKRLSEQYARISHQLAQQGVGAGLATSLRAEAGGSGQGIDVDPLRRYADGARAYAWTAAQLDALTSPGTTLRDLVNSHPVSYGELALANRDVALIDLFAVGSQVSVPAFMLITAPCSLTDLYAQRPADWPDPGAAALFSLPENAELPLTVGSALKLPATAMLSTGADPATPSLRQLATEHCTDAGRLAELNSTAAIFGDGSGVHPGQPNVLVANSLQADGSTLEVRVTVVVGSTDSFDGVQKAFAAQGVNLGVAQIAAENADIPGLLKAGTELGNDTYIAQAGDTPGRNKSGVGAQLLGSANASTPGIFHDGARVQFGCASLALSEDTLGTIAQRYDCPADVLLSINGALACGRKLAVPGSFAWPAEEAVMNGLRVPYTVRPHDRLDALCARFTAYAGAGGTATVRDCVKDNADAPGTLAKGVTMCIPVPGGDVTVTTAGIASFADALLQARSLNPDTTLEQLTDAIAALPGALQADALLLFPVPRLPTTCTPEGIADLYGVDGASFSLANTASPGLIAPGVTVSVPRHDDPDASVSVVTRANDTFNTLIVRFSLQGVATDAGAIAAHNPGQPLFVGKALGLLPPLRVREQVPLGSGGPYPDTVFALDATVTLSRPTGLARPGSDQDRAVASASSTLAPRAQNGASGKGEPDYGPFTRNLARAIPGLRAGIVEVAGENRIWCVDFTDTGIASVSLVPGVHVPDEPPMPRFFALSPLYERLVEREVDVHVLNDDGTLGTATLRASLATDVEHWAQRFLSDLDRFLDGPMATALQADEALRDALAGVAGSKLTIADGIAQQLQGVFDHSGCRTTPDPNYRQGLEAAREALGQQLRISLSEAYRTSVVAQYDTQSTTPWSSGGGIPSVSLHGHARLGGATTATAFAASSTDFDPSHAFVSFFATASDLPHPGMIRGDLDYAYSHARFDMAKAHAPSGGEVSQRLAFLPLLSAAEKPAALKNTDPGALLAPVPLRSYPLAPIVDEHAATATYPEPGELDQLPLWTYKFSCTHGFAAEDSVGIVAEFNLSRSPRPRAEPLPADLFGALAQYMAVAEPLWALLDAFIDPAADRTRLGKAASAAKTFAGLASSVAGKWNVRLPTHPGDGGSATGAAYAFRAHVSCSEHDRAIESFSLTREQEQPGPGKAWPSVEAVLPDGTVVPMEAKERITADTTTVLYVPREGARIPSRDRQTFRLAWNDINISAFQNARARVFAVHNENLGRGLAHHDEPGLKTSPAFLLKTAEVTAADIVAPLIERTDPQAIHGVDLRAALTGAMKTLFPENGRLENVVASCHAFYSYEPVRGVTTRLPIVRSFIQALDDIPEALSDAVQAWAASYRPTEDGGGWLFEVALYSGREADARLLFSGELLYPLGEGA